MTEPDDLDWLDVLAGRDPKSVVRPTEREARILREAILVQSNSEQPVASGDERNRQSELLERARRAGLLVRRSPARRRSPGRPRAPNVWLRMGVAAGIVGIALLTAREWLPNRQPDVLRGRDEVFRLQAQDPRQLKQQILTDLKAAGVPATGYEALDAQGIDADLPEPVPARIGGVLRKYGIPAPTDGSLRVEIRAQPPK